MDSIQESWAKNSDLEVFKLQIVVNAMKMDNMTPFHYILCNNFPIRDFFSCPSIISKYLKDCIKLNKFSMILQCVLYFDSLR